MTMIALKNIPSGQQIFNDFGQLPRSDLLRRYGYITDNYKKWDVVEVDIETVTRAAAKYNKLQGKEEHRVKPLHRHRNSERADTRVARASNSMGRFARWLRPQSSLRRRSIRIRPGLGTDYYGIDI